MRENRHIIGLDLLRFAAALLVVFYHLTFAFRPKLFVQQHPAFAPGLLRLEPFTWFGWIGVEIFFLISGFVISYSAHSVTAKKFLRSRFLRLYPSAWICATITLIAVQFETLRLPYLGRLWLRSMLLLPGGGGSFIDGSYWTLPVEIDFYLLILFLLATGRFRQLDKFMAGLALISSIFDLICYLRPGIVFTTLSHFGLAQLTYLPNDLLLAHGVFFALGAFLWLLLFQGATRMRIAAAVLCLPGALLEIAAHSVEVDEGVRSPALPAVLWLLSVAALILFVRANNTVSNGLSPAIRRLIRNLGLITYPLYLLHFAAGSVVLEHLLPHIPILPAVLLTTALALAVAAAVALFIEPAFQRVLQNLLHLTRPKDTETPAATLP